MKFNEIEQKYTKVNKIKQVQTFNHSIKASEIKISVTYFRI